TPWQTIRDRRAIPRPERTSWCPPEVAGSGHRCPRFLTDLAAIPIVNLVGPGDFPRKWRLAMTRLVNVGLILLVGAALSACAGNNRNYSASTGSGGAAVVPATSTPAAGNRANGASNPAVTFEAAGQDRQTIDAAANSFCAAQGKIAAFTGRN